jgi:TRAP-type C4-dicarboxylate transport system permease small subunit
MPRTMERIENTVRLLSTWFNYGAVVCMLAMLVTILVDVIGVKIFAWSVPGAMEITSMLGLLVIAMAISLTQLKRKHIEVEFIAELLPERMQAFIASLMYLVGLGLLILMSWQMIDFARSVYRTARVTSTAEIPLYPFAYITAVSFVLMGLILLVQFIQSLTEVIKK